MNNQHRIEEARFEIAFFSNEDAFSQQDALSSLVNSTLLSEIDDVFDHCSNSHSVIRIDALEVDLGEVTYRGYRHEMVERLRVRLREQLRDRLRNLRSDQAAALTDGRLSVQEVDPLTCAEEALYCYLRYGYLPWSFQEKSRSEISALFIEVVEQCSDQLVSWLLALSNRNIALFRLDGVLNSSFQLLAYHLLGRRFIAIQSLLDLIIDYQFLHGGLYQIEANNREKFRCSLWRIVVMFLLENSSRPVAQNDLVIAIIRYCSKDDLLLQERLRAYIAQCVERQQGLAVDIEISGERVERWGGQDGERLQDFISALESSDLEKIRQSWAELQSYNPGEAVSLIYSIVHVPEYRIKMIDAFNLPMLYEVLDLMQVGGLDQIKQSYELFVCVSKSEGLNAHFSHQDFWDLTLRNAVFGTLYWGNAVDHLLSVLSDLKYEIKDVDAVIDVVWREGNFNNANGDELLVASEFRQRLSSDHSVISVDGSRMIAPALLARYFETSDRVELINIARYWDSVLESHAELLQRLLKIYGRKQSIRRIFTERLTSVQLGNLIGVTAPEVKDFVHNSITVFGDSSLAGHLFVSNDLSAGKAYAVNCDKGDLWGFTFDFFFVERGSRFNKKEYCGSLLREMAAHNNCSYHGLLEGIYQWMLTLSGKNQYAEELLSIIEELRGQSQVVIDDETKHVFHPYAECIISVVDACPDVVSHEQPWQLYRDFYQRNLAQGQHFSTGSFVRLFVEQLISPVKAMPLATYARIISRLKQKGSVDKSVVLEVLSVLSDVLSSVVRAGQPDTEIKTMEHTPRPHVLPEGTVIYIKNAGQVLLAPYLPVLFERLGLLKEGRFIDSFSSEKGVHALQYMVDGEGQVPEYMMVLNKLLCGIESAQPVIRKNVLSYSDKQTIDGLLAAAIENWKSVGNTSVDGLRESFLNRDGRLLLQDEQWQLLVEARSYDMLLDQLPWSFSTIKFGWMPIVLHVEWR